MRIGFGYDSHRLVPGRRLIIGGADIPFEAGLSGHSDADVLCHAVIDAIMGAMGAGDIGSHFPDTDPGWKDAASVDLLSRTVEIARSKGYTVAWVDTSVIAERPKLAGYFEKMREAMAVSGIPKDLINIKAKTNEGMGFVGRGEGIAAYAVCLLRREGTL